MRKLTLWHPALFAVHPVLFLFAANLGKFALSILLTPLALALGLALLLYAVLCLAVRDSHKAGALASLFLVLFFLYGQVYSLVAGFRLEVGGVTLGPNSFLFPAWCVALAGGAWMLIRTRRDLRTATPVLNVVAAALVAFSLVRIGAYQLRTAHGQEVGLALARAGPNRGLNPASYPTIYYIIVDGYGRADVLQEVYGYDNSDMVDYLTSKGFYVASKSKANYAQTGLSLASSLNFTYLDDLASRLGTQSDDRVPLRTMIRDSEVVSFLRKLGYCFVAFSSGYSITELTSADVYLAPGSSLDEFQIGVLNLTPIPTVLSTLLRETQYDRHRQRILYTFDHLPDLAEWNRPAFVFAHIIAPHPPFVFGPQGEAVNPQGSFVLGDGWSPQYVERYPQQVAFVNRELRRTIDAILARATRPVIIVLQADHGPGSRLDWKAPPEGYVHERMPILNAYYMPADDRAGLYEGISPVNTFRLILSRTFGLEFDLLPDRSYFSGWERPYQFIDVTDLAERPLP